MATITGYTAERIKAIEDACIVDGAIILDDLILTRKDGSTFNAGRVKGEPGTPGTPAAPGSTDATPLTTPVRDADGQFKVGDPTENGEVVNLGYLNSRINGTELGPNVDLNTLTSTGIYTQNSNAEAATGLNYPGATALAGSLEVVAGAGLVYQTYTQYSSNGNKFYKRGYYSNAWTPWYLFRSDESKEVWTTPTYVSGWASYKTVVPAANSGSPSYHFVSNDVVEMIGGWLGRTAAVTLTAGTYYTGVFSALPTGVRPLEMQAAVGQIAIASAPSEVQWRVNPDGVIGFIPSIGGSWAANVSNSYMFIPTMRWRIA